MQDKLKTFKAYKSNHRLICYFSWSKDFWNKEQRLLDFWNKDRKSKEQRLQE